MATSRGLGLEATSRLLKNAETLSFRGAGSAREPGTQEHGPEKSMAWPVFMVSGPGPDGPSRNDGRLFQHPASVHGLLFLLLGSLMLAANIFGMTIKWILALVKEVTAAIKAPLETEGAKS